MNKYIIHQSDLDVIALGNQPQDDFKRLHELAVLENFEKLTSESEEVQLEIHSY